MKVRPFASLATPMPPVRKAASQPVDSLGSSVPMDEARRQLLGQPEKKPDPLKGKLLFEMEGVRSLPWRSPAEQLVLGVVKQGLSPFEGQVESRPAHGNPLWSVQVKGKLSSQPVGYKDQVLVALADPHHLVSLDPATGAQRWDARNILAPLVLTGERLFARTYEQEVVCLNPASGGRCWTAKPPGVPLEMTTIGDKVLAGSRISYQTGEGALTVYDARTGTKKWESSAYGARFAADDRHAFLAGDREGPLRMFDLESGQEVKTFDLSGRFFRPLLVDGDTLYLSCMRAGVSADLVAVDINTGQERWTARGKDSPDAMVKGEDGNLYVTERGYNGSGAVACYQPGGEVLWRGYVGSNPKMSVYPDGTVLTLNDFGHLRAFSAPNAEEAKKVAEASGPLVFDFDDLVQVGDFELEKQE
ncbi:MAG: PQQ-binding-like beta-propeller repeat protein [Candidatus Eremiobacteraeota bacterium]|nr:PQQ-binding-like beta-propeller repeat protein [Candidatus Eremiobacteraeota bacterium]